MEYQAKETAYAPAEGMPEVKVDIVRSRQAREACAWDGICGGK